MPTGPRIRGNNVFGFITDNPLTAGSGTFNSPGLATLPPVAAAHAVVTLDPMRQFGEPEIVIVTAHSASATVATITRGAYGTVARSHPQNTLFVHAPIDEDVIEIVTSITRPIDPYEGQFVFETDTNKLVGHGGVDWAPRDAGGQIGYAQVIVDITGFSTEADVPGLSVAVTVGTGRRIKITGSSTVRQVTSTGTVVGNIKEGAALLGIWSHITLTASSRDKSNNSIILTPSAGAHTYKLSLLTTAGTVEIDAAAENPAYILVEDIGAA